MSLTYQQKSDIRRHLKYPVVGLFRTSPLGVGFASGFIGFRFTQVSGLLEYRLNNLMPDEEARVVGSAYGSIVLQGIPVAGDIITFTVTQLPAVATQTMSYTVQPQDNLVTITQSLANKVLQNTLLTSNQFQAVSPEGIGPFAQFNPQLANPNLANSGLLFGTPAMQIMNPATFQITVSVAAQPGSSLGAFIEVDGSMLSPKAFFDFAQPPNCTPVFGYVPILNVLESGIPSSSQNLDTRQADVWTSRPDEVQARVMLYNYWIGQLADFMGVPINPMAGGNGSNAITLGVV